MNYRPALSTALVTVALFTVANAANEKMDLERITPVPAGQNIPLVDFFRPALFKKPRLNLSGTYLAALISPAEDRSTLLVTNLETGAIDSTSGGNDKQDIYAFSWLDDRHLLGWLSTKKIWGLGLMSFEVGHLSDGYPLLQYTASDVISVPHRDRMHPLIWIGSNAERGMTDTGVARINAALSIGGVIDPRFERTGVDFDKVRERNERHIMQLFPRATDGAGAGSYYADKEGELAFCVTSRDGYNTLHRLVGDKWVRCPIDLDQYDFYGPGNEPGQIIVQPLARTGKPFPLEFMDAATGRPGAIVVQDPGYDADGRFYRDRESGDILGVDFARSGPHMVWFDENFASVQAELNKSFPGLVVQIIDHDSAGRFLVSTFSDRQPPIYYRIDLAHKQISLIKNSAPWIDPARMRPMSAIKFKTRDGHLLDAYFTLPVGATKQHPPPLIVLPHGGPWARDTWGFDSEVQFLASRGYAVLQPNYRGSPGYDSMFPIEDRWDFLKMHNDVTDATKALIASGYIDSARVAIMGASFGGYLAISGVAHEPSLYRCALAISGVYDWQDIMHEEKYYQFDSGNYAYLKRHLGDPEKKRDKFFAISPINFVGNIRVPVFVAHGKDDYTADFVQSKHLVSELVRHHVPNETFFVTDEGHGMSYLKHRAELYARVEAFLAKSLMSAPVAGTESKH